jgi:hypothetical protein
MAGWIKLHRKLTEWEWYSDVNTTRVFVHLLLVANHKDNKWRGIDIKRGQRLTSLSKLADETNLSIKNIRTAIKRLKSTHEVASHSNAQHTVFTVINYDSYQEEAHEVASEGQAKGKQGATNKNVKNDNNEKKEDIKPVARAKALRVIDDSPVMAYMPLTGSKQYELQQSQTDKWKELYPSVNLQSEVSKMIGWLDANPTKRKTSRGILKFMNNWLSRAQDSGQQYQPNNREPSQRTQIETDIFMDEVNDQYERSQAAKIRLAERAVK